MMNSIACLDMDCFFVSVERLKNPSLNNKPVIVGGGARSVVAACSYETRSMGVRSGMSLTKAKILCPEAIVLTGNSRDYSEFSSKIKDFITPKIPIVEQASVDEFYLDVTGCEKLYGRLSDFLWQLKSDLKKKLELPLTIGMGKNKLIAKVANKLAKKEGFILVQEGQEASFLSPLPVGIIPGVGPATEAILGRRGIRTIGQLQQMQSYELFKLMGKWGLTLHLKAHGEGSSTCIEQEQPKSISQEETFEHDIENFDRLKITLSEQVQKLGIRLRRHNLKASTVSVKIRYANFKTVTVQKNISPTHSDTLLFQTSAQLLKQFRDNSQKVRLLGVQLDKLVAYTPLELFTDAKEGALYNYLDQIRHKHGDSSIAWGSSLS